MPAFSDSYSALSGQNIYGGRAAPPSIPSTGWDGDWIVVGDSLTDPLYDIDSSRVGFARTMYPPRVIWNAGISGQGISGVVSRFQGYINKYPSAKNYLIRIGTNDTPSAGTYQTSYSSLITTAQANNVRILFMGVTGRGLGTAGVTSPWLAMNTWLAAQCASNPSFLKFIGDGAVLCDSDYNNIALYFGDGTHLNSKGIYTQSEFQWPQLLTVIPQTDPRIVSTSDIYPANSASDQWVQNPLMSGSVSSAAGTMPTGWFSEAFGTINYTMSIVAADVGDTNQTPWMRCTINSTSGGQLGIRTNLIHPALNADLLTVKRFDCVGEVRRNNVNTDLGCSVILYVDSANQFKSYKAMLPVASAGIVSDRAVLRSSMSRDLGFSDTPVAVEAFAANTLKAGFWLSFSASAQPLGSIDFRCVSVRGSLT